MQTHALSQETKPASKSLTIWGGIIGAIPAIILLLSFFGVDVADLEGDLTTGIGGLAGLIATVMVIVGRFKAKQQIGKPEDVIAPGARLFLIGALCGSLFLSGCAERRGSPFSSTSPASAVGYDVQLAAEEAFAAYADYQAGNVNMTWALSKMAWAYQFYTRSAPDVKSLVKAWAGNSGDSQKLMDKLARIFAASSAPPAAKMASIARAAEAAAAKAD